MRILLKHGSDHLLNYGDVAMLKVTVRRLREFWPDAYIQTFTVAPERLSKYISDISPLNPVGRSDFLRAGRLFGRLHRYIPGSNSRKLTRLEEKTWRFLPGLAKFFINLKVSRRGIALNSAEIKNYLRSLFSADLVAASGGGYLNDEFKAGAMTLLSTFQIANELDIPTAIFGQGLGPIQDPILRAEAKAVLPSIKLIAVREKRAAMPLLDSFHVNPSRVINTGDDAIELAYEQRTEALGKNIGVNMRVANYSQITDNSIDIVRKCLHDAASKYDAQLIPLPTSMVEAESDVKTLEKILAGGRTGGYNMLQNLKEPSDVIRQVGRCRIVVTSSYHPGVFALAQGIPIVGLAKSQYYIDKFTGLADHFGDGCELILTDDKFFSERLITGIDRAWKLAQNVRPGLLEAAERQISSGRSAYRRFYELVESKSRNNKS